MPKPRPVYTPEELETKEVQAYMRRLVYEEERRIRLREEQAANKDPLTLKPEPDPEHNLKIWQRKPDTGEWVEVKKVPNYQ